uniref:Zinc finger protein 268 n=1 Tax=Bos taurus TaxID=9913 RepID=A0AAA9TLB8_BOVIN
MATRVRTAAIWVPPLQERDSSCNVSRKLQSEKSILDQGTPDQKPLSGGPWQRPRRPGVLEWLLISQDQPKAKKSWVSPCLFISTSFLYSFLIFFLVGKGMEVLRWAFLIIVYNFPFTGYQYTKPSIIFQLEQEELWMMHSPSQGHSGE